MTRPALNDLNIISPAQAAWDAAWTAYEPVRKQWEAEYDRADEMPSSPEREKAFHQFYKVHMPDYHRARDQFMRVPAPNLLALAKKMDVADTTDEGHFDLCHDDVRRLAAEIEETQE